MDIKEYVHSNGVAFPLAIMRLAIAFMLLWAFIDKFFGFGLATPVGMGVIDGGSPTYYFLSSVNGPFAFLFNPMADYYQITDVLMMTGLLLIGGAFLLGICSKIAVIAGLLLFLMFYLAVLPLNDNPFFDYHLFYMISLFAIYLGNGFACLGLEERWKGSRIVKRFSILE